MQDNGRSTPAEGEEPAPAEGKKRLYLYMACDQAFSDLGLCPEDFSGKTIRVNGQDFAPVYGPVSGQWYVDADLSPFDFYEAVALEENSSVWHGATPTRGIILPTGQFLGRMSELSAIPLTANCSSGGNQLGFLPPYALLDVTVSGLDAPVSVCLEASSPVSGVADWYSSRSAYEWTLTNTRTVLNCTGAVASEGHYPLLVCGTDLEDAVVTVCNGAGLMGRDRIGSISLSPGRARSVAVNATPEAYLVYYESFDRCVWGGDILSGAGGWAPDLEEESARTGSEYPLVRVSADRAGCGYVQSSFSAGSFTVAEKHDMSDGYVSSRGFENICHMLRCREHPGYISVGVGGTGRGLFELYNLSSLGHISSIEACFRIALAEDIDDTILFQVVGGESVITSWTMDGQDGDAEALEQIGRTPSLKMDKNRFGTGTWHEVSLRVENCTDLDDLRWTASSLEPGSHGFYLDEIRVRRIAGQWDGDAHLRALYWNIQNGMWDGQKDNYDRFVSFVKKYDPDICIWCEARSNYKSGSDESLPEAEVYLPNHWADLAARYGHSYSAFSQSGSDHFPQAVTSRYPLELIAKFEGGHGAGLYNVQTDRGSLSILALHLSPGNDAGQKRLDEIRNIIESSVMSADYKTRTNWLVAGDFNSYSRVDVAHYDEQEESSYWVHDYMSSSTSLHDLMAERFPGWFLPSHAGGSRIDYLYLDDSLNGRVANAGVLRESWTLPVDTGISNFRTPSDHLPILVDFR